MNGRVNVGWDAQRGLGRSLRTARTQPAREPPIGTIGSILPRTHPAVLRLGTTEYPHGHPAIPPHWRHGRRWEPPRSAPSCFTVRPSRGCGACRGAAVAHNWSAFEIRISARLATSIAIPSMSLGWPRWEENAHAESRAGYMMQNDAEQNTGCWTPRRHTPCHLLRSIPCEVVRPRLDATELWLRIEQVRQGSGGQKGCALSSILHLRSFL